MSTKPIFLGAILLAAALPAGGQASGAEIEALPKVVVPAPPDAEWFGYRHS